MQESCKFIIYTPFLQEFIKWVLQFIIQFPAMTNQIRWLDNLNHNEDTIRESEKQANDPPVH